MKKKIFALLLALCLLCTQGVLAAGEEAETEPAGETYIDADLTGVCVTEDGTVLASDAWSKVVWDLTGKSPERYAGRVSVADLSGEPMGRYYDAQDRMQAFFKEPAAIIPYMDGYAVADAGANVIRYVTDSGVQTIAGSGTEGKADDLGVAARFSRPSGLAADNQGNLYVADTGNGCIRTVSRVGFVGTYVSGLSDPMGLCWADGSLYVAESGRNRILKITAGKTEVLAGLAIPAEEDGVYYGGLADGPAARAEFDHPEGVTVGKDGTVYIADTMNHAIRMLKNGRVYTLARSKDLLNAPVQPHALAVSGDMLLVACRNSLLRLSLAEKVFEDVSPEDWCAEYAAEAALRGLVKGVTETAFAPKLATTRAQFVTLLSRLHTGVDGTEVIDGETALEDVEQDAWYAAAARWAVDKGIVLGMDGRFMAGDPLTREQAAVMLRRYAAFIGLDDGAVEEADLSAFTDGEEVSDWAAGAVRWAVALGILKGEEGALRPGAQITREQIAAVLLRFMDVYGL